MMHVITPTLSVLTAMITPAVLISACGAMILSTSMRLGRVVDRVRALSDRLEELAQNNPEVQMLEERRAMIFDQLDKLTSRARILQRTLAVLYLAIGIFVATSVAVGVVVVSRAAHQWISVVMGLIGACLLFYGSVLLIIESRLALSGDGFHLALGKAELPRQTPTSRRAPSHAFGRQLGRNPRLRETVSSLR